MNEGRTKKATINVAFNLAQQILTLILSFVSRTVFIWGLGPEYLGITGIFGDVLTLLSMADLGFGTAMVYSFYKPLAESDNEKMAALTTFYKKVYRFIATAITIIGLCLIPLLPYIINLDKEIPNITVYYILSLANVVFSYLCVYKTSILSADQKNYKITKINMAVSIFRTFAQILVIAIWHDYIIYLVVSCAFSLPGNIIASRIAEKEYPFIKEKVELSKSEQKSIFSNLRSVFIYKISSITMNATDNLLISVLVGTLAVGYYSNYLMLQNKISAVYGLLFTSLTAGIGNLIARENEKKRYEIFECEQSLSFIVCGVVIPCYVLLVNDLISVWLGPEFILDSLTVLASGLNMYLACVLQPLWSYREATGLYRKTKWIMLCCALVNLILSVLGGLTLGLAGIIFASAVARLSTYIWYEPKLLFNEYFGMSPKKYYLSLLINFLLIVSLVVICCFVPFIGVTNLATWLMKAIAIGIFTLSIVLLVYHKTNGFRLFVQKVLRFIKSIIKNS